MDIRKVFQIILHNIRLWFADPTALFFTLIAPFVLTVIISLAFSNLGGSAAPVQNIPTLIVNQDQGSAFGNFGAQMEAIFLDPPEGLAELISVEALTDVDEARQRVRKGEARAAIIIPPDFSARLNAASPTFGQQKVEIELYRDANSTISPQIVGAIVRQFLNSFTNANIAVSAAAAQNPLLVARAAEIGQAVANAEPLIRLNVTEGRQAQRTTFNALQIFAPNMSVFFLAFAMAIGVVQIMVEKENGTLGRMLATPTTRSTILAGMFGATYINGVIQLTLLIVATSLFGVLLGTEVAVWGTDIPSLALLVLVVTAAFIGLGTIIAGLSKDRVQAQVLSNAILIVLGILGGAFFGSGDGSPPLGAVSYLSPNYWGANAFTQLAGGTFPATHFVVLLSMFVVLFSVGLLLFSRRVEI
ncbi:MAG: ABC transporter permease [Chloroflexi bacterium CFX4]|nr:ABC transporter permease [Chloroflexi bacterium CFX4]MDL1921122.1 ABC transporter permease [Chloroflexi bacterium CFX3]